jgi:hypothetical protein
MGGLDHEWLFSRPKRATLGEGLLGRTVAMQEYIFCVEESPGSMDTLPGNTWAPDVIGRRIAPQKTDRPRVSGVRVKWWGKSPPRSRQRERQGKPQLEQGRISGEQQSSAIKDAAGRPLEGAGDRIPREMTVRCRSSCALRQNPAYRPRNPSLLSMRARVLPVPLASTLVLAVGGCGGRVVPRQVLTKPVMASVATVSEDSSWQYRPASRRLAYAVDQRAQLVIREDAAASVDSVSSHAEVAFSVSALTNQVTGVVTAFSARHSGEVGAVPQGLSLPLPFTATFGDGGRELIFVAPSAPSCLSPSVPVLHTLRDLWFKTPDTLRVGTTWADSASYSSCRDGVPLRSVVTRTFRVTSGGRLGGRLQLIVRRVLQTTINGDGTLAGEPVSVRGTGTGELEYTLDPVGGEVVSARGSSSLELTFHGKLRTQTVRQAGEIRIDRSS